MTTAIEPYPKLTRERPTEVGMALRDGYELLRASLARGLAVALLPRQLLTATRPGHAGELAFVHGIPARSSQSGVTFAQDKLMRRELLRAAGVPVPAGAGFAIGRETELARQFADGIGYPVVVKPRVGDNMIEVIPRIANERELLAAIDYLRTPPLKRPHFTRAAYAITLLSEPVEEAGETLVPAGYRFLVEQHVSGQYLRLLVVGDRVVSAIHAPAGLADSGPAGQEVTGELHPSATDLAIRAVQAVPGLWLAAVDLVLTDYRLPIDRQSAWVVELSERPWLAMQATVSPSRCRELADLILTRYAAEQAIPLGPATDATALDLRVVGATGGAVAAVAAAAESRGLSVELTRANRVDGSIEGTIAGSIDQIALIFELLVAGELGGQRAMWVAGQRR